MNRARRESLNCLNADKEALEFFACQEQTHPSSELDHPERLVGNGGFPSSGASGASGGRRNRSKSLVYGLTWAQAMNGRAVMPSEMFGILNADDVHWQGSRGSPGSSSVIGAGTSNSNSGNGLEGGQVDSGDDDDSNGDHRLHNRGSLTGTGMVGGGGSVGGPTTDIGDRYYGPKASLVGGQPPMVGIMPGTPKLATQTWEATLERSIRSIVSITANHVRSFDTESSGKKVFFPSF